MNFLKNPFGFLAITTQPWPFVNDPRGRRCQWRPIACPENPNPTTQTRLWLAKPTLSLSLSLVLLPQVIVCTFLVLSRYWPNVSVFVLLIWCRIDHNFFYWRVGAGGMEVGIGGICVNLKHVLYLVAFCRFTRILVMLLHSTKAWFNSTKPFLIR